MTTYIYKGDYDQITIAGIEFAKNNAVNLSDSQEQALLASKIGKAMLKTGEFAKTESEVKDAPADGVVKKEVTTLVDGEPMKGAKPKVKLLPLSKSEKSDVEKGMGLQPVIRSTVTKKDNGLLGRITKVARDYTSKIQVGYFGNVMHSGKRKIALGNLASIHEYGKGHVPKRAFVAPALAKNRLKYLKTGGKNITSVIRGRTTANQVWHLIGKEAVSDVQNYIIAGKFAPLAESTAKRKGTRVPLIETGEMYDGISYKVK